MKESLFKQYQNHIGSGSEKFYKTTLFQSPRLLLGLNCLEPGQEQTIHAHSDQDKFYFVVEGEGDFVVGNELSTAGPGTVIWAPAGMEHGVSNKGDSQLVLLMGISPPPK